MNFFYVKLPVGASLEGHEHHFHDGLESALTAEHLGSVLGWGDSLSSVHASEPVHLAFHRIDIEITDITPALALLQRTLLALDAPLGTEIHYTVNGTAWQDISGVAGWHAEPCPAIQKRPSRRA